jgi:hypothetical protein
VGIRALVYTFMSALSTLDAPFYACLVFTREDLHPVFLVENFYPYVLMDNFPDVISDPETDPPFEDTAGELRSF